MNAIIFLAPISCFDQVLQEDPSVNRLVRLIPFPLGSFPHSLWQADSFLLWKSIVSNPLLKKTDLVLFLNKCDILRAKLASGIRLADYIVSYGSRPNDFESASVCETGIFYCFTACSDYVSDLRKKFAALLKDHSPDRQLYCHFTSVTVR